MFLKELEKIVKNKIQNEIFINQDSREKKKKTDCKRIQGRMVQISRASNHQNHFYLVYRGEVREPWNLERVAV